MRLIKKKRKIALLVLIMILSVIPAVNVQAATGKTTIAVSSDEIKVGESLTVTVKVKTDSGNAAKAKMKLTYNDEILEFVSCSETYEGGAGGSVTATAGTMTVKFKAIADGKSPLAVEAGNGVATGSGSSLSAVAGCSTNVIVNKVENGAGETETIEVTEEADDTTEAEEVTTEKAEDTVSKKELEEALERNEFLSNSYKDLEAKYQKEKDFSRTVIYVLIVVIAILVVLLINVVVVCFRKMDEDFEDGLNRKKTKKTASDKIEKYSKKAEEKPMEKHVEKRMEKHVEKHVEKPLVRPAEVRREEKKSEPSVRKEKDTLDGGKTTAKPVEYKDFEVLDFNDED